MHVDPSLIEQLVQDVCCNMLGLPTSTENEPGRSHAADWSAVIHIFGDSDALVEMNVSEGAARIFAANMFAKELGELADDDIRDAVGEIVNMLGGNLKGMVPGESNLSLPCVGVRADKLVPDAYTDVVSRQFRCEGQPFRVSILQPYVELATTAG